MKPQLFKERRMSVICYLEPFLSRRQQQKLRKIYSLAISSLFLLCVSACGKWTASKEFLGSSVLRSFNKIRRLVKMLLKSVKHFKKYANFSTLFIYLFHFYSVQ